MPCVTGTVCVSRLCNGITSMSVLHRGSILSEPALDQPEGAAPTYFVHAVVSSALLEVPISSLDAATRTAITRTAGARGMLSMPACCISNIAKRV